MVGEEPRALRSRPLRARDSRGVEQRFELGEPIMSGWRDGQPGDDCDDPIEFKGPKGAWVHC